MRSVVLAAVAACAVAAAAGNLVRDVRTLLAQKKFAEAEQLVAGQRTSTGQTLDVAEATSWLGRGALAEKNLDAAARYATDARTLSLELLKSRALDAEPHLPLALGASIEVHAQVLAARGQRSEAVEFLNTELATYRASSIRDRIQKNINLLSLEGKPAPRSASAQWKGHPALIFLWAHWCGDCKGMAPALAALRGKYAPRGLTVVAPTRHYGYTARGADAPPAEETRYIQGIWARDYAPLAKVPTPIDANIFHDYGVSTTPTLVLVDHRGIVRLYHPGAMKQDELEGRIAPLVKK